VAAAYARHDLHRHHRRHSGGGGGVPGVQSAPAVWPDGVGDAARHRSPTAGSGRRFGPGAGDLYPRLRPSGQAPV